MTIDSIQELLLNITTDINPQTISDIIWLSNGDTIGINQSLSLTTEIYQNSIIQVVLTDNQGCIYYAEQKIDLIENNNIYIPNIFSPSSGFPLFSISGSHSVTTIDELSVFDRWGTRVYQHKNLNPRDDVNTWDGTFNGKPCQIGVYIYSIVYTVNGKQKHKSGDICLIQ